MKTLAAVLVATAMPGCFEDKPVPKATDLIDFDPVVGETWVYEVHVTLDPTARLPEGLIEMGPEGAKLHSTKTRTYLGIRDLEEGAGKAHCFEVRTDDGKPEFEFVLLSRETISAKGWEDSAGQRIILQKPMTLWSASAAPGDSWVASLPDPNRPDGPPLMSRQFLYFGKEEVKAGDKNFNARHMQMEGNTGPLVLRHDYWFADKIGYVKERRSYFMPDRRVAVMEETLVGHTRPGSSKDEATKSPGS